MDLNRVTLLGRLTRDPELRTTPSGQQVATVGIATGRTWTDKNGVKQERTEFHNCVLWGRLAEIAAQYLNKGSQVYVEGRLQTRDWVGQDGVKRYRTEIVVTNLIMLGGSRKGSSSSSAPTAQDDFGSTKGLDEFNAQSDDDDIKVEDIPF